MRKCLKTAIFWHFSVYWSIKSVSPEFCNSCKVISCSFFADWDGWEAEKSCNSAQSVFCVKNADFHQITEFYGGKCACIQTLDMRWIDIGSKYCTLNFISSLERKRSSIQCKIWNCPPHPLPPIKQSARSPFTDVSQKVFLSKLLKIVFLDTRHLPVWSIFGLFFLYLVHS